MDLEVLSNPGITSQDIIKVTFPAECFDSTIVGATNVSIAVTTLKLGATFAYYQPVSDITGSFKF